MKLKIALLTLISLPISSSEPEPVDVLIETKYPMPNRATILALLNSNNEGHTFTNPNHNQTIAADLADKYKSREEILRCFLETTKSSKVVEMNDKTNLLIDGAQYVKRLPKYAQNFSSPN